MKLRIEKLSCLLPRIHFEIERWKWNNKYNIYVSNFGNFKNENGQIITPMVKNTGYLAIKIKDEHKKYILAAAHRLVLCTWAPRDDMEVLTVDHLDSNKRNNKLSNLEWCSEEENLRRADKNNANSKENLEKIANEMVEDFFADRLKIKSTNITVDKENFKTFLKHSGLQLNQHSNEFYAKRLILSAYQGKKYCGHIWEII